MQAMTEPILTTLTNGVLTLTLNRPAKRNALDTATLDGLAQGLARADLDRDVRVVALRGAGKDFCAGADLTELLASVDRSAGENEQAALALGEIFLVLRRLPKPSVMTMLRRSAGEKRAFELVATGRQIAAEEALAVGLVSRVIPDATFADDVDKLLARLAGLSPTAFALTKQLFTELEQRSFTDGVLLGARVNALSRTTEDFRRAVTEFLRP